MGAVNRGFTVSLTPVSHDEDLVTQHPGLLVNCVYSERLDQIHCSVVIQQLSGEYVNITRIICE